MKMTNSLIESLKYAQANSPYYTNKLKEIQFNEDYSYKQFTHIPFTSKEDLATQNQKFRAVSLQEVAEYATTSGTSGKPVTIFLTATDLERLAYNEATSLETIGVNNQDVIQLMTTMDRQFMAGLAYYLGTQKIGAGMVRLGPGVPALQWQSIITNEVTTLIAVPSFIVTLLQYALENKIDFTQTKVRKILCIGEPLRDENLALNTLGKRIKDYWNVELYSTYASTEMSAAFTECQAQNGGHLVDDLLFLEVLDSDNQHVKNGEVGEIVVTTIGNQGTPLIRYRTGDLAKYYDQPCSCGRMTPRLGPIVGRKNQMIKYKGTTLYPNAIYDIFDQQAAINLYKVEVSKDYLGQDVITVLLPKSLEGKLNMEDLSQTCRAKLKVVPHFLFLDDEYLRNQVFKKHMRKPEKIIFK